MAYIWYLVGSPSGQLASLALVSMHFCTLLKSWRYGFGMVFLGSPNGKQKFPLALLSMHVDSHPMECPIFYGPRVHAFFGQTTKI